MIKKDVNKPNMKCTTSLFDLFQGQKNSFGSGDRAQRNWVGR